jgi:hypothetical protein
MGSVGETRSLELSRISHPVVELERIGRSQVFFGIRAPRLLNLQLYTFLDARMAVSSILGTNGSAGHYRDLLLVLGPRWSQSKNFHRRVTLTRRSYHNP